MTLKRFSRVKARDKRYRYITTVFIFSKTAETLQWGISIATADHHSEELGEKIATDRAMMPLRQGLRSKKLNGYLDLDTPHVDWFLANRAMLHAYVDHIHTTTCQNINNVIWPAS